MAQGYGRAALAFAEAMCPPGNGACVEDVARTWEQRVETAFGVPVTDQFPPGAAVPAAPFAPVQVREVRGPGGTALGRLVTRGEQVTLCLSGSAGERCAILGRGPEAEAVAGQLLQLLGFVVD